MRRQIFFFHMANLIVALLTLLAVSGGVLHLVFRAYQDQAVPAADSRSDQVQSTLASWPEEARDWWELDQNLAKLDYRLAVEQNHQVVYSSLNRFQEDLYNHIFADASWPELGTLALQDQGVFIVGRRCGDAVLVAMMEPQTPEMFGQQRPQVPHRRLGGPGGLPLGDPQLVGQQVGLRLHDLAQRLGQGVQVPVGPAAALPGQQHPQQHIAGQGQRQNDPQKQLHTVFPLISIGAV